MINDASKNKFICLSIGFLIVWGWSTASLADSERLSNGSFDASPALSGWQSNGNVDPISGAGWKVQSTPNAVDMNGTGTSVAGQLSQLFDTVPGGNYTVSYWLSANWQCGASTKTLTVNVDGVNHSNNVSTGGTAATMPDYTNGSFTFVASGSQATLTFDGDNSGSCGPVIDTVSVFGPDPADATASRTPWQQHEGLEVGPGNPFGIVAVSTPGCPSVHGDPCLYNDSAGLPAVDDPNWFNAPDPDIIGFGNGGSSKLGAYACLSAVDFNYFQTLVNIPASMVVSQFTIDFSGMDDGSRVSICNSAYPGCYVIPGSYVYLGLTGTTNLADYVVAGEANRVVITQVDDCATGNQLRSAVVTLNGQTVDVFNLGISQVNPQELINTSHEVSATLLNQSDQPVSGAEVTFKVVAGQNAPSVIGSAVTNGSGVATTSYVGSTVGFDTIQAFVDDNGTTRESNVLVVEWVTPPNSPPVAVCEDVQANTDAGACSVTTSVDAGSSDPDGDLFTTTQSPAGPYSPGTTLVTLTADDGALTSSCSAVVTVVDAEHPAIDCPAPVVEECTSPGGAAAQFSATATDNCSVASVSCDQTSGATFPLGDTPVSCSAMDVHGNSASCSTQVTVVDTTAPTVACNIPAAAISGSSLPLSITATGADTCSTPTVSVALVGCTKDRDDRATECEVSTNGATIRIRELGKGKSVNWTATAVDGSGHSTTVDCSISRGASDQGVGNGDEGSDPGNSDHGDPANSNDENGGTPGDPGRSKSDSGDHGDHVDSKDNKSGNSGKSEKSKGKH